MDILIKQCRTLIVDEAHERTIDMALGHTRGYQHPKCPERTEKYRNRLIRVKRDILNPFEIHGLKALRSHSKA